MSDDSLIIIPKSKITAMVRDSMEQAMEKTVRPVFMRKEEEIANLRDALRELVDTMPECEEAYHDHWDGGVEKTEAALRRARKLLEEKDNG